MPIEPLYNEPELLLLLSEGNESAYQKVFHQYYPGLCFFAQSIVQHKEDAEDIVQDMFQKLWQKKQIFATIKNLKGFLFAVVRNACLDFIKFRQRQYLQEENFFRWNDAAEINVFPNFDPVLSEAEIMLELYHEIESLPEQCRKIFKMAWLEGLKNEEIATSMNLSYNTIRAQKLRALKLIRASLLKKGLLPLFMLYIEWLKSLAIGN